MNRQTATFELSGITITIATTGESPACACRKVAPIVSAHSYLPPKNDGEEYAGFIVGQNGERSYHLFLLAGEVESSDWESSKKWAVSIGGELPNRREQSLLFTNLKEQFKEAWHWSSEQHSGHSGYAWSQYFNYGSQFLYRKVNCFRARAVRRLFI